MNLTGQCHITLNCRTDRDLLTHTTNHLVVLMTHSHRLLAHSFAVTDANFASAKFDTKVISQPCSQNFEMKFAHATKNNLTRLLVNFYVERRIF